MKNKVDSRIIDPTKIDPTKIDPTKDTIIEKTKNILTENIEEYYKNIKELSEKYNYTEWQIIVMDMQRNGIYLENPPSKLIPNEIKDNFQNATLIIQGNGFTFTTAEDKTSPYKIKYLKNNKLKLTYKNEEISIFDTLSLLEIMGKPSLYYFPFKEKTGKSSKKYLIVNPYENCAYRCAGCSRIPFFKDNKTKHYEPNIKKIIEDVLQEIKDPNDVKFINIITWSTSSDKNDFELYKKVIETFNKKGFNHCKYWVYTSNIKDKEYMEKLKKLGVIFFTPTIEVVTEEAREKFYSNKNKKWELSFEESIKVLKTAEEIFDYVNTNIMLGYEPKDELVKYLKLLKDDTNVSINHFIPRIFSEEQKKLIHPEARNLEYYVSMCSFIEKNINTNGKTFADLFQDLMQIKKGENRFRS